MLTFYQVAVPSEHAAEGDGRSQAVRRLLDEGKFVSPGAKSHARQEMEKYGLTDVDAVNVLRGGAVREAEFENGSWRHRGETPRMVFVVVFDPEPERMPAEGDDLGDVELVLVTGWRIRS